MLAKNGPDKTFCHRCRLAKNVPDENVAILSNGRELLVVRAKAEERKTKKGQQRGEHILVTVNYSTND